MRKHPYACVLTIAGTDPSGGAGVQADIKSISATGSYAASVMTALVAQNTRGVQEILDIPTAFIAKQLDSVGEDLTFKAVKIGMMHQLDIIATVAEAIDKYQWQNIVLDPVMVAKNGALLLVTDIIADLKRILFPKVSLITPNLYEAEQLVNQKIESAEAMEEVAKLLGNEFGINVLLKGGHLPTQDQSSDVLFVQNTQQLLWYHGKRTQTKNTHGTGCSLSSAIASYLAQGHNLPSAIQQAKNYLTHAIASGSNQHIGHGNGPIDHFYFLNSHSI